MRPTTSLSTADDQRVILEWDGSVDLEALATVDKGNWRSGGFPYHDYKCSVRPNWVENWDQWTQTCRGATLKLQKGDATLTLFVDGVGQCKRG